jgi:membrane-associated protein
VSASLSPWVAYLVLFAFVAGESAGLLLPGETALITAGVLAGNGRLEIVAVIAIASVGAVLGDNLGFAGGRYGGRRLLESPRVPFAHHRAVWLERGDAFFARHGGKAVLLGRFVIGVRVVVAWVAGINGLPWRTFVIWNLLGGVLWATTVGLLSFWFGTVIEKDLKLAGYAGIVVVVVALPLYLLRRRRSRSKQQG